MWMVVTSQSFLFLGPCARDAASAKEAAHPCLAGACEPAFSMPSCMDLAGIDCAWRAPCCLSLWHSRRWVWSAMAPIGEPLPAFNRCAGQADSRVALSWACDAAEPAAGPRL
jgi:hypothetical protein